MTRKDMKVHTSHANRARIERACIGRFHTFSQKWDRFISSQLNDPTPEFSVICGNYSGATPDPSYIPEWRLTLDGLALSVSLNSRNLFASFQMHEQITRLVCVEG